MKLIEFLLAFLSDHPTRRRARPGFGGHGHRQHGYVPHDACSHIRLSHHSLTHSPLTYHSLTTHSLTHHTHADLYNQLRDLLQFDNAIAGEAAALGMGLIMAGTGNLECAEHLRSYGQETQHEKIIRGEEELSDTCFRETLLLWF